MIAASKKVNKPRVQRSSKATKSLKATTAEELFAGNYSDKDIGLAFFKNTEGKINYIYNSKLILF